MENYENNDYKDFAEGLEKAVNNREELKENSKYNEEMYEESLLNPDEIKDLVPKELGFVNLTLGKNREPMFPEDRQDIAIIQRDIEDGDTKGVSGWFVVYKNVKHGGYVVTGLYNTGDVHDNYHVKSVKIINDNLVVEIEHSGKTETIERKMSDFYGLASNESKEV